MARLLVFCEAPADFETTRGLVERVLKEEGPDWLRDLIEGPPEVAAGVLDWVRDQEEGRDFFDLHKLSRYVSRLGIRVPQGHFASQPGAPGALMARTAFRVARELVQRGEEVDAVLLVWDMDDQGEVRCQGLGQARDEARKLVSYRIVLGCPDPMREAWVLAGFEPDTDDERTRLGTLRQELGFDPCQEAHRLDAKKEYARKSPKRVLHALLDAEPHREARCWSATPLSNLHARGQHSGLTVFLGEVADILIPLFTGAATPPGTP